MEPPMDIIGPSNSDFKIVKWKVRVGSNISNGSIICLYDTQNDKNQKLKSNTSGTVEELVSNVGENVLKG